MKMQCKMKNVLLTFVAGVMMFAVVGCGDSTITLETEESGALNITGFVTEVTDAGFSLEGEDGEVIEFATDDNTVDVTDDEGKEAGDYVTVIYVEESDSNLATDISLTERSAQGTVTAVDEHSFDMQLIDSKETISFTYDSGTTFNISGGTVLEGDQIIVNYYTTSLDNYATAVNAQADESETTEE